MSRYLLAHDLGTSGDKATIFCEDGRLIGAITQDYATHYGENGAAEQDPREWWRVVCETTAALTAKVDKRQIAAVSFSGQMMGVTCMSEKGELLGNSIIWADTRSVKEAEELGESYGRKQFYLTTGTRINPSYSITKLMWLKKHDRARYDRTYKTLCCKDYIVYRLTGTMQTDHTDACLTLAYDVRERAWADGLIAAAGIERDKFPEIKRSDTVVGAVTARAAAECGLVEGTPVVLGCGDGGAGKVGAGIVRPRRAYSYLGTSAWTTVCTERPVFDEKERVGCSASADPRFCSVGGTMQAAGASINWMKRTICQREAELAARDGVKIYKYLEPNAALSPAGANGLMFLPYLNGERAPHWNARARGAFIGLTMKHTTADMQRAVMEGICLNLGLIHRAECENGVVAEGAHKLIGGCTNSPTIVRSLADIYDTEVALTDMPNEATSIGAAIIAGKGVGIFKDDDVAERFSHITRIVEPIAANVSLMRERLEIFEAAYEALESVFPLL